ncbi:hypothetical protein BMS3Bbin04_01572 [bacterium BMS3Bbin04]|nr:hypothetical protein BMS3Bbin04_01572 [bacterium BMS3Bbin04]
MIAGENDYCFVGIWAGLKRIHNPSKQCVRVVDGS